LLKCLLNILFVLVFGEEREKLIKQAQAETKARTMRKQEEETKLRDEHLHSLEEKWNEMIRTAASVTATESLAEMRREFETGGSRRKQVLTKKNFFLFVLKER
jgi:plasmid rolling circle replication initiator protein Rep